MSQQTSTEDGSFPTFVGSSHSASSGASSSERTPLSSNRSKSSEPPAARNAVSSLAAAAAKRSKSAEPPKRLNTRVFQPSLRLPATQEEVDANVEEEYERRKQHAASWTAFGHDEDDSRLPTISPPTLPGMSPSPPPLSSKRYQASYRDDEEPLSPTHTDTTAAESDISIEEQRRLQAVSKRALTDENLEKLFSDEDKLLEFVAKINAVYEHTLRKDAPFMTFVLCGVQSAGKSYLVERFMNAVLNIVDDGTATRCPLDITCIHNADLEEPMCDLEGIELTTPGMNLTVQDVFDRVTLHNRRLESENRVSKKPLHLIYRAKHVQNMRFVDTPGTKMNQDSTKDDRKAIQEILTQEMRKPNAKLCILLQSTEEFATQPIVRFCDETFGSRGKWIGRAIFLMTKSDLLVVNKRSAADANKFFAKFHENHCFPHLIITPTLPHQGMKPDAMYRARKALLERADEAEADSFERWFADHDKFNAETGNATVLNGDVKLRIGFPSAKKVMRNIMLEDTRKRLPEVLMELRGQIETLQRQWDSLEHRRKLRDPDQLKPLAMQALRQIEDRVSKYINGNLNACRNFPERMQTLGEEIQEESFSEWSSRKLNHHKETNWRQRIEVLDNQFPSFVQPNKAFLGGKQIQRAIEFFRAVMVDSLPDPQGEFRDLVANSVGYLANGTLRENWEQALVQIVETCVKEMTHPGINYVVKHVGYICRRLFRLAMDDIKQDDRFYDAFKVLPVAVEKHFMSKFDGMLWGLMQKSADRISMALEPMVCVDMDHQESVTHNEAWPTVFNNRSVDLELPFSIVQHSQRRHHASKRRKRRKRLDHHQWKS